MHLFDRFTIRDVTFRNRIVVSPMCQYSCENGVANDWHLVHLGARAIGGAGLVITEAAAVVPEGRISPEDLGIWNDQQRDALARVVRFIDAQGAVAGIQLAHAGRKASTAAPWKGGNPVTPAEGGWVPIYAPSPVPFAEGWQTPVELDVNGIRKIIDAFAAAAKRALDAGFKVIELHGAHGYLFHEFLSPLSNQRSDQYGGSLQNRMRIVTETAEAVRRVWPERLPLFLRISATDWVEDGWTPAEAVELAKAVKRIGVDLIDCSSGGNLPHVKIPLGPGYQVPFSRQLKQDAGILTGAVGLIDEPEQANQIIASGDADMVLLAREFLRDPNWPLHAALSLGIDVPWPQQYDRAKPRIQK